MSYTFRHSASTPVTPCTVHVYCSCAEAFTSTSDMQVPSAHIERLDLIPDIDQGILYVDVVGSPAARGMQVQVSAATVPYCQGFEVL